MYKIIVSRNGERMFDVDEFSLPTSGAATRVFYILWSNLAEADGYKVKGYYKSEYLDKWKDRTENLIMVCTELFENEGKEI
jgi:hypothetical protein